MTINGTYQIRDLTIVNPTYEVKNVNDNLVNKTCNIEVIFDTDSVIKYSYSISGFSYSQTWEDADIFTFVEAEIQKLDINYNPNARTSRKSSNEVKKDNSTIEPIVKVSALRKIKNFFNIK